MGKSLDEKLIKIIKKHSDKFTINLKLSNEDFGTVLSTNTLKSNDKYYFIHLDPEKIALVVKDVENKVNGDIYFTKYLKDMSIEDKGKVLKFREKLINREYKEFEYLIDNIFTDN